MNNYSFSRSEGITDCFDSQRPKDNVKASTLIQQTVCKATGENTPGRPQDALLCDMDRPLRRRFYPLGFAVEILTYDPNVLVAANESFDHRHFARQSTVLQIRIGN